MKKLLFVMVTVIFVFLFVSLASAADIPMMLNYQGYVDDSGVVVNGEGYFKFAIVDSDPNCTTYWSNDGTSTTGNEPDNAVTIPVTDGFFTIKLGNTDITNMSALSPDVFDQQNIFVRVWFSIDNVTFEQLSPDTQIISSGFAYKAQTALEADKLDGKDASGFALEDHIHEYDYAAFTHTHSGQVTETIYDDGSNVGIGTTNPDQLLHIEHGNLKFNAANGGYSKINFYEDNALRWGIEQDSINKLNFQWDGASKVTFDGTGSRGYVGIGTTSPEAHLEIAAGLNGSGPGIKINSLTRTGSDIIFETTGTAAGNEVVIQSNGNVGIGTTSPVSELDVNGSIRIDTSTGGPYLQLITNDSNAPLGSLSPESNGWLVGAGDDNHDSQPGQFVISRNTGDKWNQVFNITSTGNVGIGTTIPKTKLQVWGALRANDKFPDFEGAYGLIYSAHDGDENINNDFIRYDDRGAPPGGGLNSSGGVFSFHADSNRSDNWDTPTGGISAAGAYFSGNVGIGTDEPDGKLHVVEGGGAAITRTGAVIDGADVSGNARLELRTSKGSPYIDFSDDPNSDYDARIIWNESGTEALELKSSNVYISGNVGIGTTSPTRRLHIYHDIAGPLDPSGKVQIDSGAFGNGQLRLVNTYSDDPADETSIGFIGKNDRFWVIGAGAGTGAISDKFGIAYGEGDPDIVSAGSLLTITNNGNVGIGTTSPSYKLDVDGTIRGDNVSSSDIRLKENIEPIDNALEKVANLRGVYFEWKDRDTGEGRDMGLIAQEVEDTFPEVVSEDQIGYKSINYGKLIAASVEAIKELKAQNEALTARNTALETRISALEAVIQP